MTAYNDDKPLDLPAPDLTDFTIIIAEDNPANQIIIQKILSKTHANVYIYDNGQQALAGYNKFEHVDLVILDIHMPVMNGIELCETIRKNNLSLPILALTADVMIQDKALLTHYGFTDIITKPLQLQQLYQFIHDYCSAEQV